MIPIRAAILRMASTVCRTTSPFSLALVAERLAMSSVTRAFSAFWATVEEISSTAAEVSSTLLACSVAVCESACAEAEISSEAAASVFEDS